MPVCLFQTSTSGKVLLQASVLCAELSELRATWCRAVWRRSNTLSCSRFGTPQWLVTYRPSEILTLILGWATACCWLCTSSSDSSSYFNWTAWVRAYVNCAVRKCEVVNCEVECEVFMRGACKLQGRKVRGATMTARGRRQRDTLFIA